jgi:hypothetical protein
MKINKNYEGIIKEKNRYYYDGDIISEDNIEIELDMYLYVSGKIVGESLIVGVGDGWKLWNG